MSSCYTSWKIAKTGEHIPCFIGDKPSTSLYNPMRDAEQFTTMVQDGYTVICGLASGLHVNEVVNQFPNNKIIVVETNNQTIDFLLHSGYVTISNNVVLCTIEDLESTIVKTYFPPLDGNFSVVPLRSWVDANKDTYDAITVCIKSALSEISSDVSTQAQFGKIWNRNILQNLSICETISNNGILDILKTTFPTQKKAFIAGAGPGLEDSITELKCNRNEYFIISTDTAFHALSEQDIDCDIVVSIDPQLISTSHFMCKKHKNTIFAFDLCANTASVRAVLKEGNPVCFFKSNHPLCVYADNWFENIFGESYFPTVKSDGGTVTLTALNFARLVGFSDIVSAGCDFAYTKNKMYAKGIYMDSIFNAQSKRTKTTENCFLSIMFRSPLIRRKNSITTNLLNVYKQYFDNFFKSNSSNGKLKKISEFTPIYKKQGFVFQKFIAYYRNNLNTSVQKDVRIDSKMLKATLLPYIAWYVRTSENTIKKSEIYKIALNATIHF